MSVGVSDVLAYLDSFEELSEEGGATKIPNDESVVISNPNVGFSLSIVVVCGKIHLNLATADDNTKMGYRGNSMYTIKTVDPVLLGEEMEHFIPSLKLELKLIKHTKAWSRL